MVVTMTWQIEIMSPTLPNVIEAMILPKELRTLFNFRNVDKIHPPSDEAEDTGRALGAYSRNGGMKLQKEDFHIESSYESSSLQTRL